jgi:hypothetical protein
MVPRSCEPYSALHHSRARARALGTQKRGLSRHKRPPPRSLKGRPGPLQLFHDPRFSVPRPSVGEASRCAVSHRGPVVAASQTKETIMIIGKFENQANGRITGKFEALLVGCIPLTFEPNSKGADYTAPKPAVKLARPGRRPARKVARPSFPFGSIHRSCRCRLTPRCSPPRRPGVTFFGIGQSAKRNNRRWTSGAALCGPALFQHQQRSFS